MESYIGKQGYTIYKSSVNEETLKKIRSELMVKAYIPKSPIQPPAFPVYRESPNKIYVPRYYGIEEYGNTMVNKLPPGDSIDISFNGSMRPYQNIIVDKYTEHVGNSGGGLLDVDPGKGKTVMGLNIISKLKKKTLVVVHKSFLLNQWIERIQQFLPSAKVGKIQGQIIDIEDKDIVIGMLQSLSMKTYPKEMFDCFGLTIYDEVHHLSAEVFSQCMIKITTNYTLGLSATMQRKDGLTKVFKMFLGMIVHKEKAEANNSVLVKAVNFKVNDEEFNETSYDFRGNPKYSTMISKLCNYNRRSEFILRIIQDELHSNPDQQIMILAHNKTLINYLYKAIEHKNIASVGYYVGGMKDADLKISETKKIIIATYAMASEGLDIKTLSTLVMATPKSDVCQSVGRILRVKHSQPLVIDIVDSHDVFKNQFKKRASYYMKQKYNIIETTSAMYPKYDVYYDPLNHKQSKQKLKTKEEPLKGKCLIKIDTTMG